MNHPVNHMAVFSCYRSVTSTLTIFVSAQINPAAIQRLYQALTSTNPPPGPPYSSTTNFASLRAGPGTARPVHATHTADPEGGVPGVTTFRVSNKDRTFVDEVQYKGWTIKLADWLHLSNPDDPGRPIVAQVFKCWVSDEP
jgi:chromatin structure-remodeling complex subunit RSC1/2